MEAIAVLASSAFCAYKILPLEASTAMADFAATEKSLEEVESACTWTPVITDSPISKLQKIKTIFFMF